MGNQIKIKSKKYNLKRLGKTFKHENLVIKVKLLVRQMVDTYNQKDIRVTLLVKLNTLFFCLCNLYKIKRKKF